MKKLKQIIPLITGGFLLFMLMDVSSQCESFNLEIPGDDPPEYNIDVDTDGINLGAKAAESAMLTGETSQVLSNMSEYARSFYEDKITEVSSSKLEAMGNAFKNRQLKVGASTYAEFEFEEGGVTYSMALGLQDDGTWKIIRL